MRQWWRARLSRRALLADAEEWHARHGARAAELARLRSMDAYLLGDLIEQERWGRIRELIEARDWQ